MAIYIREHGNAQYCTHVLIDAFRENDTLIFEYHDHPTEKHDGTLMMSSFSAGITQIMGHTTTNYGAL